MAHLRSEALQCDRAYKVCSLAIVDQGVVECACADPAHCGVHPAFYGILNIYGLRMGLSFMLGSLRLAPNIIIESVDSISRDDPDVTYT